MRIVTENTSRPWWLIFSVFLVACASNGIDIDVQARQVGQENTTRVYKKVAPATVFIKSALTTDYAMSGVTNSIGSGVILDRDGSIVTNSHVVENAARILVILHDGTHLSATVIGSDPFTDLALLRVDLPESHRATVLLGNSDRMEIGQEVAAIGHPFGFGYALTTGVVSGFGTAPDDQIGPSERVIQTSAAINPGNSGGPLVDKEGMVVGINMAVMAGSQNIGFAIPINTVKAVVDELRTHGRVARPWLGIRGMMVPDRVISLFALPLAKGLLVARIDMGSPAQKAGLRAGTLNVTVEGEPWVLGGDIIVAVNGLDVTTMEQFAAMLTTLEIGQTVAVRIFRNGTYLDVSMIIDEYPQTQASSEQTRAQENMGLRLMDRLSGSGNPRFSEIRF